MLKQILMGTTLVFFAACTGKNDGQQDYAKSKSGFNYKIFAAANPGDTVQWRSVAKVQVDQYIDDSLLSSTVGKMPQYIEINNKLREYDYTELLRGMRKGDSAVCIFSTAVIIQRAVAGQTIPEWLKRGKDIIVRFKILGRFNSEAEAMFDQEQTKMKLIGSNGQDEKTGYAAAARIFDSLIKKAPQPLTVLDGGISVYVKEKGAGEKLKTGDEVSILGEGKLVNGTVFEQHSVENPFVIHVGKGEVLKGFDAGLAGLHYGDKATIYIPAPYAYGAQQVGQYIPAFSNVIYDVQIAQPVKH